MRVQVIDILKTHFLDNYYEHLGRGKHPHPHNEIRKCNTVEQFNV